jgi:hypothetical protein
MAVMVFNCKLQIGDPRSCSMRRWLSALVVTCVVAGGCDLIGGAAVLMRNTDKAALYKGLPGQSVAVMVWVDRGPSLDFPDLQAEIASSIQSQIIDAKAKELKDTHFINPLSVIRFQNDHPEVQGSPIQEVAARLGVSRVIYLEVQKFETHAPESIALYRGDILASLSVVEVNWTPAAQPATKVAYQESGIRSVYPKMKPEGVEAEDGGEAVRHQTVRQFAGEIAERFFAHAAPDNEDE